MWGVLRLLGFLALADLVAVACLAFLRSEPVTDPTHVRGARTQAGPAGSKPRERGSSTLECADSRRACGSEPGRCCVFHNHRHNHRHNHGHNHGTRRTGFLRSLRELRREGLPS